MKEKLYTIEMNDALNADDECCFCWLERKLERENLEFVLGSSYMESDIREQTSEKGFCRHHTKMMYDYGNTLGNAWILKSRLELMRKKFKSEMASYGPAKSSGSGMFGFLKKSSRAVSAEDKASSASSSAEGWLRSEECHCYVCDRMGVIYERMMNTFVYMLRNDPDFGERLMKSKGFCMHHFADILRICEEKLKPQEKEQWIPKLAELMERNLERMQEDIDWMIEKFDYRNQDADWKNSRDAVQRTMQKLVGSYPADPPFQNRK